MQKCILKDKSFLMFFLDDNTNQLQNNIDAGLMCHFIMAP